MRAASILHQQRFQPIIKPWSNEKFNDDDFAFPYNAYVEKIEGIKKSDYHLYKVNGEVVAIGNFGKSGNEGWVNHLSVRKDMRGKGIGGKFVEWMKFQMRGVPIYVKPASIRSNVFFRKHGFVSVKDPKYGKIMNRLVYRKSTEKQAQREIKSYLKSEIEVAKFTKVKGLEKTARQELERLETKEERYPKITQFA